MFRLDLTAYYSIRHVFFFFFLKRKEIKASTVSTPFFLACFISILDETLHKSAFDYTSSRPIYQRDQKHLNAKPTTVRKVRCVFHR